MSSRSRETADVFIEQDQLARAYSGTNMPTREQDRLGDLWFVESATQPNEATKKLSRSGSKKSLSKRTSYYKKEVN
jgi:hypothetical protein